MYDYQKEKNNLYSDLGLATVADVLKNVFKILVNNEEVTVLELTSGVQGDSFRTLAAIDWLEQNGYIAQVSKEENDTKKIKYKKGYKI